MSTVRELLADGYRALVLAEVDTPMLDAAVLLADALATTKERLLASLPDEADAEGARRFQGLIAERQAGRPVSYIRRRKEFWGLDFHVDERVLVPRPDTEALVERALLVARADPRLRRIHDACTGSGCVAIAIASELPGLEVSASDVSESAIEVCRLNCLRLLGREIAITRSDLLAEVAGTFDLVTANPPYLRDEEVDSLAKIGWPEPALALRGGPDGTLPAAALIGQAAARLAPGGWLCLEAAPGQFPRLHALMDHSGFLEIGLDQDLGARDRVIFGRRPGGEAGTGERDAHR